MTKMGIKFGFLILFQIFWAINCQNATETGENDVTEAVKQKYCIGELISISEFFKKWFFDLKSFTVIIREQQQSIGKILEKIKMQSDEVEYKELVLDRYKKQLTKNSCEFASSNRNLS